MRQFNGAEYYNCDHLSDAEMARIHGLPVRQVGRLRYRMAVVLARIVRWLIG